MAKVWTIVAKEWSEVFKNRLVLFTVIFMPLLFVALPLITLAVMGEASADSLFQKINLIQPVIDEQYFYQR